MCKQPALERMLSVSPRLLRCRFIALFLPESLNLVVPVLKSGRIRPKYFCRSELAFYANGAGWIHTGAPQQPWAPRRPPLLASRMLMLLKHAATAEHVASHLKGSQNWNCILSV